jgi:thiol-disulfide isomerase/thioredoxin
MASRPPNRTPLVLGIVAAVVVVIVAVVVIVSQGGDDDTAGTVITIGSEAPGTDGSAPAGGAVDPLAATVEVTGDPLAELPDSGADPAVGAAAPALAGTNYAGEPVEITPGDGGATMVIFLAHWCPHCNAEIPVLLEWQAAGGIPDELEIVGVSTGVSPEAPNYPPDEWLADRGWPWPVLADSAPTEESPGAAAAAYGVSGFPFFTIVAEDGTVLARGSGEKTIDELDALVSEALGA